MLFLAVQGVQGQNPDSTSAKSNDINFAITSYLDLYHGIALGTPFSIGFTAYNNKFSTGVNFQPGFRTNSIPYDANFESRTMRRDFFQVEGQFYPYGRSKNFYVGSSFGLIKNETKVTGEFETLTPTTWQGVPVYTANREFKSFEFNNQQIKGDIFMGVEVKSDLFIIRMEPGFGYIHTLNKIDSPLYNDLKDNSFSINYDGFYFLYRIRLGMILGKETLF
jgi:hypothetical protein